MTGQIQYGRADLTTSDQTGTRPVQEHFACGVRMGRRKVDPVGRLVLTGEYLRFQGSRDIEFVWRAVAAVDPRDDAIVVSLRHTRRILFFCCTTAEDAARGTAMARELMALRAGHSVAFG